MPAIHLIKKSEPGPPAIKRRDRDSDVYTSGNWALSLERAQSLIGAQIYFHVKQRDPSYFGGIILGVTPSAEPENHGRVVFTLQAKPEAKGIRARGKWGRVMLIVD